MMGQALLIILLAGAMNTGWASGYSFMPQSTAGTGSEPALQDTSTVNDMVRGADQDIRQGNMEEARRAIDASMQMAEEIGYEEGLAEAHVNLGDWHLRQGRSGAAIEILEEASERFAHTDASMEIDNLLANAYRFDGRFIDALELFYQVEQEAEARNDERTLARLQQNMGVVYDRLGDQSEALKRYHVSLEYAEAMQDTSMMVVVTNSIGHLNTGLESYDQAEHYLQRSLNLADEYGVRSDMIYASVNLGNLYKQTGEVEEALEHYNLGLEVAREMGDIRAPVQVLYNRGDLYLRQERLEAAQEAFEESLELNSELGLPEGKYHNHVGLGQVTQKRGEYETSIEHLQQALQAAERMESLVLMERAHRRIAEIYEQLGNHHAAYDALRQADTYSDSLVSQDMEQTLARYETEFGLRQERQERELLEERMQAQQTTLIVSVISALIIALIALALYRMYRKKHAMNLRLEERKKELEDLYQQLEQQKAQLQEINRTNKRLFSILAHDLREPISSLQSVVYLFQDKDMQWRDVATFTERVDHQLQRSLTTLENFLTWARNQLEGFDPAIQAVDPRKTADEVVDMLDAKSRNKEVALENRVPESCQVMADSNMLRIILVNLVSNSLKFSQYGDTVTIDAQQDNDTVIIRIIDTGTGIHEKDQPQLFEAFQRGRTGTANEEGSGLGLSLCKEFTEMQNGRIWFDSQIGAGTTFYVRLPAAALQGAPHSSLRSETG